MAKKKSIKGSLSVKRQVKWFKFPMVLSFFVNPYHTVGHLPPISPSISWDVANPAVFRLSSHFTPKAISTACTLRWCCIFTHVRSWHLLSSCFQPIFACMPQQLKPQPYSTGWERNGPVDKKKLQPKDDPSSPWRPYSFNAQKSRGASAAACFWWFSFSKHQQSWIFFIVDGTKRFSIWYWSNDMTNATRRNCQLNMHKSGSTTYPLWWSASQDAIVEHATWTIYLTYIMWWSWYLPHPGSRHDHDHSKIYTYPFSTT